MYNDLINQQFLIDFNCEKHSLNNNLYQTNKPYKTARYFARQTANIVVYNNHLYIRTSEKELTQLLKELFKNVPPEWAFESQYLHSLISILSNHSLKITNICPFFIPIKKYALSFEEEHRQYRFFYSKDILQFKNDKRITMSFGYSTEESDLLGLGYFEDNELIAICGAIKNGRYTCDIGVEILDDTYKHQGIATKLVKNLTAKLQELYPTIIPVYSTCLSHTNSMNVAIKSGFQIGWTELLIEN